MGAVLVCMLSLIHYNELHLNSFTVAFHFSLKHVLQLLVYGGDARPGGKDGTRRSSGESTAASRQDETVDGEDPEADGIRSAAESK